MIAEPKTAKSQTLLELLRHREDLAEKLDGLIEALGAPYRDFEQTTAELQRELYRQDRRVPHRMEETAERVMHHLKASLAGPASGSSSFGMVECRLPLAEVVRKDHEQLRPFGGN